MTPETQADLQQFNAEIAGAMNSPWEPGCLVRAFASPGVGDVVFTMQAWIDLERLRSPLLHGALPATVEEFAASAAVFGCDVEPLDAQEIFDLGHAFRRAIAEGFGMNLPMTPPRGGEAAAEGFGAFLPLLEALIGECGLSRTEALATPVGQGFALLAARRRREGWSVAGQVYALREVLNETEDASDE